jgi:hypothetical protein
VMAPKKGLLLNEGLLVTAITTFETLLVQILAEQLRRFPALLPADEPRFSLKDLQEFDSLEDAREAVIEKRVDSIMRDGFSEWETWFENRAGVSFEELCIDHDGVTEAFQRRHLVVHKDARVDREYLRRLGREEPPEGTVLRVEESYLEDVLDELDVFGVGLGTALAIKWFKQYVVDYVADVNRVAYSLLELNRNRACVRLCQIGFNLADGEGWTLNAMRVNGWIAQRRLAGRASIKDEVDGWDVSALAPEFRLAKLVLLGEHDKALDLLSKQPDQGELIGSPDWPLFEELREESRFKELFSADGDART